MAVGRKHIVGTDPRSQRHFVGYIAKKIEDAGFKAHVESNRALDLSFYAANGDRIGVECEVREASFGTEQRIRAWRNQIARLKPAIKETLVLSSTFSTELRDLLDGYHGIEMVRYADFPRWMERYKPKRQQPKPQSLTARIASTVKTNRDQIVVATEALALQIDGKIARLKDQKPNSPDAIDVRNSEISDYEALRAQVAILQQAVAKLTASAKSKEQAAEAAMSFGDGVQGWWNKQHAHILEKSAEMGVVLSAVGVCSLLGVNPAMAMVAATALVGGKSVAKALKGVIKVNA